MARLNLSLKGFPFRRTWGDVELKTEKVGATSATISLFSSSTQMLSCHYSSLGPGKSLYSHTEPPLKKQFGKFLCTPKRLPQISRKYLEMVFKGNIQLTPPNPGSLEAIYLKENA